MAFSNLRTAAGTVARQPGIDPRHDGIGLPRRCPRTLRRLADWRASGRRKRCRRAGTTWRSFSSVSAANLCPARHDGSTSPPWIRLEQTFATNAAGGVGSERGSWRSLRGCELTPIGRTSPWRGKPDIAAGTVHWTSQEFVTTMVERKHPPTVRPCADRATNRPCRRGGDSEAVPRRILANPYRRSDTGHYQTREGRSLEDGSVPLRLDAPAPPLAR